MIKRLFLCIVSIVSAHSYAMDVAKKIGFPASLIPIDRLSEFGLCPLYPRYEEFTVDGEVIKSMLPVKFKRLGSWDLQLVDKEGPLKLMPCVKRGKDFERDELVRKLVSRNTITNRILMQLKTINQNQASEGAAMCAGLSLRNSALLYDYARTGKISFLSQLPDMKGALDFLDKHGCVRWVNPELLPSWIEKVGVAREHFSVIPTVFALDERYHTDPLLAYSFEPEQLKSLLQLRSKISQGISSDLFFHTFIIGDYEVAQRSGGRGHYFSFSIFKVGTTVEYVIVDTQVESYHLRQGTYEYARIWYLINLLESGANSYDSKPLLDLYKDTPIRKD